MNYTILDAYNVLFSKKTFGPSMQLGHHAASEYLLQWVVPLIFLANHSIIAVFDGGSLNAKCHCYAHGKHPNFIIVQTKNGCSADEKILEIIQKIRSKQLKDEVEVITNDGGLRTAANHEGATVLSVENFFQKVQHVTQQQRDALRHHRRKNEKRWSNFFEEIWGENFPKNPSNEKWSR
ncbi:MAG: NYN domain-containing protein [Puniceicoccales bacterium]|jgi:predicted RNA-binding protein with PIN domain|nr:NYN domain-containing protein [Puniceicoccales bacterium]